MHKFTQLQEKILLVNSICHNKFSRIYFYIFPLWNWMDGKNLLSRNIIVFDGFHTATRKKNRYFTVRLTVSVDPPPLRSAFCDFFWCSLDLIL